MTELIWDDKFKDGRNVLRCHGGLWTAFCSMVFLLFYVPSWAQTQDIGDFDKMSSPDRKINIAGQDVYYYKGSLTDFKKVESAVLHWAPEGVYLEADRIYYQKGGNISSSRYNAFRNANIHVIFVGTLTIGDVAINNKNTMLQSELRTDATYGNVGFNSSILHDPTDFSHYHISGAITFISCSADSSLLFSQSGNYGTISISRTSIPKTLFIDSSTLNRNLTVEQSDSISSIQIIRSRFGKSLIGTDKPSIRMSSLSKLRTISINSSHIATGFSLEDVSTDTLIVDNSSIKGNVEFKNVTLMHYGRLHEKSFPQGYDLSLLNINGTLDVYLDVSQQQRSRYRYSWEHIRSDKITLRKYPRDSEADYQKALTSLYNAMADEYRQKNDHVTAKDITERLKRTLRERAGGFQRLVNILFPEQGVPPALWIIVALWAISSAAHLCFRRLRYSLIQLYDWNIMRSHHIISMMFVSAHHSAGVVFGIRYRREWLNEEVLFLSIINLPVWILSKTIYFMALLYAVQNAPFLDFVRTWFS